MAPYPELWSCARGVCGGQARGLEQRGTRASARAPRSADRAVRGWWLIKASGELLAVLQGVGLFLSVCGAYKQVSRAAIYGSVLSVLSQDTGPVLPKYRQHCSFSSFKSPTSFPVANCWDWSHGCALQKKSCLGQWCFHPFTWVISVHAACLRRKLLWLRFLLILYIQKCLGSTRAIDNNADCFTSVFN